jgi:hypothetical protein
LFGRSTTPPQDAEVRAARSAHASMCAKYPPGHPDVVEAKRRLVAANLAVHIDRIVNGLPRLTNEQLDHCAALLMAGKA